MTARSRSNHLALAVLSCLNEGPMHPYEVATTLRMRSKDASIKLNYGSLYSLVEGLEKRRLIEPQETTREGRRPERTVYKLTDAGRIELMDWLADILRMPEKEYPAYEAGLSLMPNLPPNEVVALLQQRVDRLEYEIRSLRTMEEYSIQRGLPRLFAVETDYRLTMMEAERTWTAGLMASIQDGSLDGLDLWRAFHRPGAAHVRPAITFDDVVRLRELVRQQEGEVTDRPSSP